MEPQFWDLGYWPSGRDARHGGKAMLFKEFANIDAFPICLDTKDVDQIVATVKAIAQDLA